MLFRHQKVSMVFNFHVDQQLEVKIVFQDMKNTLCGKISDEVEVTLYRLFHKSSVSNIFLVLK